MLYRKIASVIEEHLQSGVDKILLIDGARQVGKTFIIRHVGKKLFENYIEVNMVEDAVGDRLFAETRSVDDFYLQLSMISAGIALSVQAISTPVFPLFESSGKNLLKLYLNDVGILTGILCQ